MPKCQKFKCDILSNFQTMCRGRLDWLYGLHWLLFSVLGLKVVFGFFSGGFVGNQSTWGWEVHQVNPIEKGQNTLTDKPSWPSFLQVYRALMDAVVLDWTISLADKDRMKTCAVTYLSKDQQQTSASPTTIQPFLPQTRTFLLENLTPNQVSQHWKNEWFHASHCLKITKKFAFEFWHFPPIFVLLKLTCLVTLFDRKLQVFKNSPKWTIFGMFN